MSNDRIEISFDGEDEPEKPSPNRLTITNDDLAGIPDKPVYNPPQAYGGMPQSDAQPFQKKTGAVQAVRSGIAQAAIAGLLGGLVAWLFTEPFFGEDSIPRNVTSMLVNMGIFGGLIGGIIGCFLGAADGVVSQVWEKAVRAGCIGLGIGAAGGFLGGIFGQIVYSSLLASPDGMSMGSVMIARIFGWGIVGIFVGLGQGVGRGSGKRVVNGLIGGVIGGLIAGALFDPIGILVKSGVLSRAVGITILGGAAGTAIGLVEEVCKEAWLSVVQGPLSGKQFILYEVRTRIGSSPKCEITLMKDPAIMPEHAVIEKQGNACVLVNAQQQASTLLNGQPAGHARLQSGNVITIGATSLLFEEKAIAPPANYS